MPHMLSQNGQVVSEHDALGPPHAGSAIAKNVTSNKWLVHLLVADG